MHPTLKHVLAGGMFGALLYVLALAACPQLHEQIHHDTGQSQHECAVTLMQSGGCDSAPAPVMAATFVPARRFNFAELPSKLVASVFLTSRVLEHAPPA